MIRIYYHVYAVNNCIDIVNNQLDLLKNSIEEKFELNIILLQGRNSDDNLINKTKDWLETNNYSVRKVVYDTDCRNEWQTLDCIIDDKDKFNDDDCILYLHTKGVTHSESLSGNRIRNKAAHHRFNYEKFTPYWKNIMEYYLIKNYKECVSILKKGEYNTVGTFLNEPMWYCLTYAGNMFWLAGNYAKTLGNFENTIFDDDLEFDKKVNSTAEFNFVNSGINWKPYSVFNIPYDIFTNIEFINLLKSKKDEN